LKKLKTISTQALELPTLLGDQISLSE